MNRREFAKGVAALSVLAVGGIPLVERGDKPLTATEILRLKARSMAEFAFSLTYIAEMEAAGCQPRCTRLVERFGDLRAYSRRGDWATWDTFDIEDIEHDPVGTAKLIARVHRIALERAGA